VQFYRSKAWFLRNTRLKVHHPLRSFHDLSARWRHAGESYRMLAWLSRGGTRRGVTARQLSDVGGRMPGPLTRGNESRSWRRAGR
jgi:hypothetical protein